MSQGRCTEMAEIVWTVSLGCTVMALGMVQQEVRLAAILGDG